MPIQKQFVFEVLDEVNIKKTKAEKIQVLKDNDCWALRDIIRGSMDKSVEWDLPPGAPPYRPAEDHNAPTNLVRENKKFAYFVKGGPGAKMQKVKREQIFIGMLEGIHPVDARLVINMINKEKPEGLNKGIVEGAFPGLVKKFI